MAHRKCLSEIVDGCAVQLNKDVAEIVYSYVVDRKIFLTALALFDSTAAHLSAKENPEYLPRTQKCLGAARATLLQILWDVSPSCLELLCWPLGKEPHEFCEQYLLVTGRAAQCVLYFGSDARLLGRHESRYCLCTHHPGLIVDAWSTGAVRKRPRWKIMRRFSNGRWQDPLPGREEASLSPTLPVWVDEFPLSLLERLFK